MRKFKSDRLKGLSWGVVGETSQALSRWLVVVIFAKLSTPDLIGKMSFAAALLGPVMGFSQLGMRTLLATDFSGRHAFGDYVFAQVGGLVALCVLTMLAVQSHMDTVTTGILTLLGLSAFFEGVSSLFFGLAQREGRMDLLGKSQGLRSLLRLGLVFLGTWYSGSILGGLFGAAVGNGLVLVGSDIPLSRRLLNRVADLRFAAVFRMDVAALRELWWMGLPLGLLSLVNGLTWSIPRFFIEGAKGDFELGIFSALNYLTVPGTLVVSALGHQVSPELARCLSLGRKDLFSRELLRFVLGTLGISALSYLGMCYLVAPQLYWIYTVDFQRPDLVPAIMLLGAATCVATAAGFAATAARLLWVQLPLLVGSTVVLIATSWLLVPAYGVQGAVYANAGTLLLHSVVLFGILVAKTRNHQSPETQAAA